MASRNHLGKTLFFAAGNVANTEAGFEAVTWLELENGKSYPQFGVTHSNIDVEDLKSGFTKGIKGAASGVDSQGACNIDDSTLSANQATFKALCADPNGLICFKIATGSGTDKAVVAGDVVTYAQGYVHSYTPEQATVSTSEGFTYNFKQNDEDITSVEPA